MSAIVSIPELPRRRDFEKSMLLDSRICVVDGDTTTTDVEGERDIAGIRTQPRKGGNLSTRTKFFGVELSPDNVVVAMVYFVQGVLGLARLAKIQLKKVSTLLENLWEEAMVFDGNNGGAVWLGGGGERIQETENEEVSWGRNQEDGSQFKPMLEGDWFSNPPHPQDLQMLQSQQDFRFLGGFPFNPNDNLLLHQSIDSSSSCSPSQAFSLDPSQKNQFLSTNNKSCLLNVPSSTNPFDNAFEFGSESGFLGQIHAPISMGFGSLTQLGNRDLSSVPDFLSARSLLAPENNNNNGGFVVGGGGVGFSAPLELEGFGSPANGGFVGAEKERSSKKTTQNGVVLSQFFLSQFTQNDVVYDVESTSYDFHGGLTEL